MNNTTYSEFVEIPHQPGPFKGFQFEASTEKEGDHTSVWRAATASFTFSDGQQIATLLVEAYGHEDAGEAIRKEAGEAVDTLIEVKRAFDEWYATALQAFGELATDL